MSDGREKPSIASDERTGSGSGGSLPNGALPTILGGDFELAGEIGRGGMGTVFRAYQRSLKRTVAVKVLSQQVSASPTAVLRFQREAQAAAKLNHAHIVPIFALGEDEGTFFYAMEFVDGPGLNEIIGKYRDHQAADTATGHIADTVAAAEAPPAGETPVPADPAETQALPPRKDMGDSAVTLPSLSGVRSSKEHYATIARHIASIADALDYAHKQGVIHRDIKPHNLILGLDDNLRVSDFGLARLAEQPGVTVTGELVGSPLYMSPEQLSGEAGSVDHRTDIYSLGATMYEWLSLAPPYPGDTRERVISQILTTEPVALRTLNAEIPVDIETICLKAMERDLSRRYQTAAEMRDDLQRFALSQPIQARRSGAVTRMRKFIGRHQLASITSVAAVLALGLTAALLSTKREVKTQTAAAEQALEDKEKILDLLGEITDLLPAEVTAPIRAAEAVAPVLEGIVGSAANVETAPAGSSGGAGADPSTVSDPLKIALRAVADFHEATTARHDESASASDGNDIERHVMQAKELATADPKAALAIINSALDVQPEHFDGRRLRAVLQARLGRFDQMLVDAEELVRMRPGNSESYAWRGAACMLLGLYDRSVDDLAQAIELGRTSPWPFALHGLALRLADRYIESISSLDEALERSTDMIVALLGRASSRKALGNVTGAVSDLSHVLEVEPSNAHVLTLRGDYHVELKDFTSAQEDFESAMAIAGRTAMLKVRQLGAILQQRRETPKSDTMRSSDADAAMSEGPTIKATRRGSQESWDQWLSRLLGFDPKGEDTVHSSSISVSNRLAFRPFPRR